MEQQKYAIKIEGFILGNYYAIKDTIQLSEKQAATFVKEGRIAPFSQKKTKPAADGKAVDESAK